MGRRRWAALVNGMGVGEAGNGILTTGLATVLSPLLLCSLWPSRFQALAHSPSQQPRSPQPLSLHAALQKSRFHWSVSASLQGLVPDAVGKLLLSIQEELQVRIAYDLEFGHCLI